jgi:hypothetical protein
VFIEVNLPLVGDHYPSKPDKIIEITYIHHLLAISLLIFLAPPDRLGFDFL